MAKEKRKIRPLRDQVLVRKVEAEAEAGGIALPENSGERHNEAVVVAVSKELVVNAGVGEPPVKAGDRVVVNYGGVAVKDPGGEELILIAAGDILAVIE